MKLPHPNTQKIKLDQYLKCLTLPVAEELRGEIGEEILTLIFAYARSKAGLNIRLHRRDAEALLFFTAEELFAQKGNDPDLNNAYDLLKKIDPADTASREAILNLAERVLKNRTQILKRISKKSRVRKEHPFKQIVRESVEDHRGNNHIFITDKAIAEGCRLSIIYEVDKGKKIIFSDHFRAKDISFPTIRDWITDLKDEISSS